MQEVADRTSAPYSAVCYITATFPDGLALRGSGAVVGVNDVLTALHLVYQAGHGGWATHVTVVPGADTAPFDAPFGSFTQFGSIDGRTGNWDPDGDGLLTDADAQGDLALIGLVARIGDQTGWLEPLQLDADVNAVTAGFPAHPPAGAGEGMMALQVFADASQSWGVYDINDSLGAGGSGGPLIYTSGGVSYVTGVLSSGGSDNSSTYAALFGSGTWDWLQRVMAANDAFVPAAPQSTTTGTDGGDVLAGDAQANTITALGGDDTLTGATGNDTLDGGAGLDIARYTGPRAAYTVTAGVSPCVQDHQASRDGTDTLTGIERVVFADGALALDLDGHAGLVARLLGAVFGRDAVGNAAYAGIGIARLDQGMDAAALAQLALDVKLGANAADAAVVNLLYTNVTGQAPAPDVAAFYVGQLQSHAYAQATIALYAAQTSENADAIGLAGLAASGLAYEPAA
jgi:hypothetical protein